MKHEENRKKQETEIREELKKKGYELGKQERTTRVCVDMRENQIMARLIQ